jgi:hypothetical protein
VPTRQLSPTDQRSAESVTSNRSGPTPWRKRSEGRPSARSLTGPGRRLRSPLGKSAGISVFVPFVGVRIIWHFVIKRNGEREDLRGLHSESGGSGDIVGAQPVQIVLEFGKESPAISLLT